MFPSVSSPIVAFAGGGQVGATLLSPDVNRVITVASIGDSVRLPAATSPISVVVINSTANSMQVYGTGSDTINGVASGAGIPQLGNSIDFYVAGTPGQWFVESGLGFAGAFPTVSSTNAITATPSGTQANSAAINTAINRVTTVATAGDSVKLPVAAPGMQIIISNAAGQSMSVWPGVGDAVNGGAANASYPIAAGKTVEFFSAASGFWHAVLSA